MKALNLSYILLVIAFGVVSGQECHYEIVESMPDKLIFKQQLDFQPTPTHKCLIDMINNAKNNIKVASFYLTLTADQEFVSHPSAQPGKQILESMISAANRGVKLEVVLDNSSRKNMNNLDDVERLRSVGSVKFINMSQLLRSGVLHTKFLIADDDSFYLGSSNFDWRSYSQIKEIGIFISDCSSLTQDLDKIFQTYMFMANQTTLPANLPENLRTSINLHNSLNLTISDYKAKVFLGASPPVFNGVGEHWIGRTDDVNGLLHIISKTRHRLDISVMNYSPTTEFIWPRKFWPRIDDALRRVAFERKVQVRLLFSDWTQNKPEELMWYSSLNKVRFSNGAGIYVKMFKVPAFDSFQKSIPYARVKHDKYMVTDDGLYIGTSNWSADYFISTCGVSLVIEPNSGNHNNQTNDDNSIIRKMQDLFDRDFASEFAHDL